MAFKQYASFQKKAKNKLFAEKTKQIVSILYQKNQRKKTTKIAFLRLNYIEQVFFSEKIKALRKHFRPKKKLNYRSKLIFDFFGCNRKIVNFQKIKKAAAVLNPWFFFR